MTAPKIHVATSRGAGQAVPARTGEGRTERGVVYHTDRPARRKRCLPACIGSPGLRLCPFGVPVAVVFTLTGGFRRTQPVSMGRNHDR